MNPVREAFKKVKEDIAFLKQEIKNLSLNLNEIRQVMDSKKVENELFFGDYSEKSSLKYPTDITETPTDITETPTDIILLKSLKSKKQTISTGNVGVPTDRQTDRQTDRHIKNEEKIFQSTTKDVFEILNSLDTLKKEIRLKFKKITNQELAIFSAIYQFDEEKEHSNYQIIARKLNLSESSVRDYVRKLINKGIPIEKKKINNKTIQLSISENLKKIASLSTILQLRDL